MNTRDELERYTKDEIIYYLTQVQMYLPAYRPIKDIILEKRLDDVSAQIDKNLKKGKELQANYEGGKISGLDYILESAKKHKQWEVLNKKYNKISKELFSDIVSELKPCRRCGGEAVRRMTGNNQVTFKYAYQCGKCLDMTGWYDSDAKAIKVWNAR